MRRDANLQRRTGHVVQLQALKAIASRAQLVDAQTARIEAGLALQASDEALAARVLEMEALLASEMLDFDRWRIGGMLLEELAHTRDADAETLTGCEQEEAARHIDFHRESTREDRAAAMERRLTRHLEEKRDDAAVLEANALVVIRRTGGQG